MIDVLWRGVEIEVSSSSTKHCPLCFSPFSVLLDRIGRNFVGNNFSKRVKFLFQIEINTCL